MQAILSQCYKSLRIIKPSFNRRTYIYCYCKILVPYRLNCRLYNTSSSPSVQVFCSVSLAKRFTIVVGESLFHSMFDLTGGVKFDSFLYIAVLPTVQPPTNFSTWSVFLIVLFTYPIHTNSSKLAMKLAYSCSSDSSFSSSSLPCLI